MTNKKGPSRSTKGIDPELITSLYEISTAINALMEVDEIAAIIIEHCLKRIDAEQGMVYLLDKSDNNSDMFKTFLRGYAQQADKIPFHINQSLAAMILKNRSVILCNETGSDKRFQSLKLAEFGINSLLSAPLITRQGMIGILVLVNDRTSEGFTDHDKRFLGIVGTQVAKVVEAAHLHEEEKKLIAIREELGIAHDIQKRFLPSSGLDNEKCTVTGLNIPAKDLGGDFFDIVQMSEQSVFVSLGDVMGKGIPAALIMSNAMAVLRSQLSRAGKFFLADIADSLNNMVHMFTPPGQFITTIFGEYVCKNKSFSYVNAGHPPLIIVRSGGETESPPGENNDIAIGILPDVQFSINKVALNPGDMLFIYSDGITECFNKAGEEFGEQRLEAFLKYNHTKSAEEISRLLPLELDKFRGDGERSDDITFLIIQAK